MWIYIVRFATAAMAPHASVSILLERPSDSSVHSILCPLPLALTSTLAYGSWSRKPILRATITLSQRNGSLLTAFLDIFVTIAGGACWRILTFLIYQHRVGDDKDALHPLL